MQNDIISHIPVLLAEVLEYIQPKPHHIYIDATFGAGGYSRAILERSDEAKVIGIDRDLTVLPKANEISKSFPNRFSFIHSDFASIQNLDLPKVDAIVFDLGVSSMQIDQQERGFSFYKDGPLDMRMDQGLALTAADIVNNMPETELANVIFNLSDERFSRRIAKAIVAKRKSSPFKGTLELAECISEAIPKYHKPIHPATKTFQAIRMLVNDELKQIEIALNSAVKLLNLNGRIVIVTFHSKEDMIVKEFFANLCGTTKHIWDPITCNYKSIPGKAVAKLLTKSPVLPGRQEVNNNVRSRSAKLRVIEML